MELPDRYNRTILLDLLLVLVIALGVFFRFSWVDWNEGADLHPDEYGLTSTISSLRVPPSLSAYFNTRLSTLSPYNKYDEQGLVTQNGPDNRMRWGQWPITIIRVAAEITGQSEYGQIRILGRRLSALTDTLSLLVLFLAGWRLYSRRAGLLAAALSALAVMQIQQSHFMTADNFGVLFSMLCLYCSIEAGLRDTRRWPWYALSGVFLGMAVASRINLVVLAGIIGLAALLNIYRVRKRLALRFGRVESQAVFHLALAAVLAVITFRLVQPMSFRATSGETTLLTVQLNKDWTDSMKVAQEESNGINAGPPGEQWTNRTILLFPWVNMVVWGMGPLLGLAAWAGFFWAAWRTLRGKAGWQIHLLPLAWVGGYFLFMGTRHVMSMRYFLPIYPFLFLFAAWALLELYAAARRQSARVVAALLAGSVVVGSLAWAASFVQAVYLHENTRLQASRWILQNIPGPITLRLDAVGSQFNLPIPAPYSLAIAPNYPYTVEFTPRSSGILNGVYLPHLASLDNDNPARQLRLVISQSGQNNPPLAQTLVAVNPIRTDLRGEPSEAAFPPVTLLAGQTYTLAVSLEQGGAAIIQRVVVANENWDESLPVRLDGYDPFGQLYNGLTMEVRWPDNDNKLQMYRAAFTQAEYIIMPSQRSIWSISRLPELYPMTMEYYQALFSGQLGYEQVASFQAPWRLGPLYISDLAGAVAWGHPPAIPLFNNRLLASEEAFTVYDHAPVWIFKKSISFNLQAAWDALK